MQPFIRHVPPLRDILELVNNRGQTAFDIHTLFYANEQSPFDAIEQRSAEQLNPVNAEATAKSMQQTMRFRDKLYPEEAWLLKIVQ